jgi:hypothetical protein
MSTALAAVKRELLVRYLDTWAPAALHGARRATYAEVSPRPEVALRVFAEFPELLARHPLDVVLTTAVPAEVPVPAGVAVRVVSGALLPHLADARDGPLFVHLDLAGADLAGAASSNPPGAPGADPLGADPPGAAGSDPPGAAVAGADVVGAEPPGADVARADLAGAAELAGGRATELLLAVDPAGAAAVTGAGFDHVTRVELVDEAGTAQLLIFGTGSAKHLAAFKEALWAVDEYAGVRYRDPTDDEHSLLDISLSPHVGPLKRALLARVRQGPHTVAELRDYTLAATIYRAADVSRVLTALLGSGALARTPQRGRLTAETVIAPGTAPA